MYQCKVVSSLSEDAARSDYSTINVWAVSCEKLIPTCTINTLKLSDTTWCHRSWLSLLQAMACRLFGAKPLLEPILTYDQFSLKKRHIKYRLQNVSHFVQYENFITHQHPSSVLLRLSADIPRPNVSYLILSYIEKMWVKQNGFPWDSNVMKLDLEQPQVIQTFPRGICQSVFNMIYIYI